MPSEGQALTGVFALRDFYLLDVKMEGEFPSHHVHLNTSHVIPEWAVLAGLVRVAGCQIQGLPFSWKLMAKFPSVSLLNFFLFSPTSSSMAFPSLLRQLRTNFVEQCRVYKLGKPKSTAKEQIDIFIK